MKRIVPWVLAVGLMVGGSLNSAFAADACTRDGLKAIIGKYFAALEAKDPSSLPLATNVKFTENGVAMPVGQGLWKTAGKVLLKRDLLDTFKCGTHSNVVIEEPYTAPKPAAKPEAKTAPGFGSRVTPPAEGTPRPILYGVRLKIEGDKISEIEAFVARETEFAFNAPAILADTKDQDWESIIPPAQRSSRLAMIAAADDYYDMFAKEPEVRTPFAFPCDRWENGFMTTGGTATGIEATMAAHDCSPTGLVISNHPPRRFLVDVEAGTMVAYILFAGSLPDFHMFRMRDGKVDLIQSVIGAAAKDMGWPHEPIIRGPSRGSY
ncbi:MAG: hypothetical protein FWF13_00770 [Acidobacteria bacterium]|nr:hypothetical protein [Acidobacteriota bacterium]